MKKLLASTLFTLSALSLPAIPKFDSLLLVDHDPSHPHITSSTDLLKNQLNIPTFSTPSSNPNLSQNTITLIEIPQDKASSGNPDTITNNVLTNIQTLASQGIKDFIVLPLPPISNNPSMASNFNNWIANTDHTAFAKQFNPFAFSQLQFQGKPLKKFISELKSRDHRFINSCLRFTSGQTHQDLITLRDTLSKALNDFPCFLELYLGFKLQILQQSKNINIHFIPTYSTIEHLLNTQHTHANPVFSNDSTLSQFSHQILFDKIIESLENHQPNE